MEMIMENWLSVGTAVFLIGMMLYGHYRGFIRQAVAIEPGAEGPRLHGQNPYADGPALLIDQRSGAEEVDGKETGNLLSLGK